jgi:sterol 3beta-glucosyltransferase
MKIAMIALGSRGDVQPYIALGKGLQAAGHFVRLVTHENYERLVSDHQLDFWPVSGDVQAFLQTDEMRDVLASGNFLKITRRTAKEARRAALSWTEEGLTGCQGMDLLIAGIGGLYVALALAEKLALPLIQAHVIPFTPTAAFPGALMPQALAPIGGILNRWSHHLTRQAMWQGSRAADRVARQQVLKLPTAPFWGPYNSDRMNNGLILYGFSPAVLPKPADWNDNTHVTGYWFLDAGAAWTPSPALLQFLQAGPPPVCIGFGSMSNRQPEKASELILHAVAQANQRAIILSGWDGFQETALPKTVFVMESAPHDWLFQQVTAVVHHGGAGTTAAGLRAGVPSILIPFFGDQPFWGRRVVELGVGPAPIPRAKLTTDNLAQAINQAVTDQAMRQRAATLGAKIQAEDGVTRAVSLLEASQKSQS